LEQQLVVAAAGEEYRDRASAGRDALAKENEMRNKVTTVTTALIVVCCITMASLAGVMPAQRAGAMEPMPPTAKQMALHDAMRALWLDHIGWTRLLIISAVADLPDQQAVTERLLQNQVEIGNAIKPYYGTEAGNALTRLLEEHIGIAAELAEAAQAKDAIQMADARRRWEANADEIAAFLNAANPEHWPLATLTEMLHAHLDLTASELQARLRGDWATDISVYSEVQGQILAMADALSSGIVMQFPEQF
jgi:hypothetical protein